MVVTTTGWASTRGATVLVTGGTAGIGYATAARLAAAGADVVITGRDPARGTRARQRLNDRLGVDRVRFEAADHSTVEGNLQLARRLRRTHPHLDILVNNVGGLFPTRRVSADGLELTVALNLRAAVVLTTELRPALTAPSPDRLPAHALPAGGPTGRHDAYGGMVVNVASDAYRRFRADPFTDVEAKTNYEPFPAYARAKLLLVLATLALAHDLAPVGITLALVNPGMAWTPNTAALTPQAVPAWRYIWPLVRGVQRRREPERAGAVVADLATRTPRVAPGAYITSSGQPRRLDQPPILIDTAAQRRALHVALELAATARS